MIDVAAGPLDEESAVIATSRGGLLAWARQHSLWGMPWGGGCCAAALMGGLSPRWDLSRFGVQIRPHPSQADLLLVCGRISLKMIPELRRIHAQLSSPKWVMAVGACACSGGIFDTYAVLQGADRAIPIDAYVPGCPPRPEDLIDGLLQLQQRPGSGRTPG